MIRLQGIAVSPGVAVGQAVVFNAEGRQLTVSSCKPEMVEHELKRLELALQAASDRIRDSYSKITDKVGQQYGAIFVGHLGMLQDEGLNKKLVDAIRVEHCTAEYAVYKTLDAYARMFQMLSDPFLAERANDVHDLERQLLEIMMNEKKQVQVFDQPVVIFARNLTPSETASMDTKFVQAFATELGGPSSHTAIVAEALHIPAVVGVGLFLEKVQAGDMVIVDGDTGTIIVQPDPDTLDHYINLRSQKRSLEISLGSMKELLAQTTDGTTIQLFGNIEFPREAKSCVENHADGIGLYRTEFLYFDGKHPNEEEHYEAYRQVVESMNGKPVTIRTVDLGADKLIEVPVGAEVTPDTYFIEEEKNPCLGLRSIRLSLKRVELFRNQLRAILRAAYYGPVKVMFPLVSTIAEWRQARMIVEDVKEDLLERGLPFNPDTPVGIMVEVPSVVLMIEQFAKEVDFFSIGTNDLTQYTLAVDRTNKDVVYLYNSCDPVILKLIAMTVRAADEAGKGVSLCGQLSSNSMFTPLLIGLGLRSLSMSPGAIPEVKRVCRNVSLTQCKRIAERALRMEKAQEVRNYLYSEYYKLFPELDGEVS